MLYFVSVCLAKIVNYLLITQFEPYAFSNKPARHSREVTPSICLLIKQPPPRKPQIPSPKNDPRNGGPKSFSSLWRYYISNLRIPFTLQIYKQKSTDHSPVPSIAQIRG